MNGYIIYLKLNFTFIHRKVKKKKNVNEGKSSSLKTWWMSNETSDSTLPRSKVRDFEYMHIIFPIPSLGFLRVPKNESKTV